MVRPSVPNVTRVRKGAASSYDKGEHVWMSCNVLVSQKAEMSPGAVSTTEEEEADTVGHTWRG